jgi:membrane protein YdbS with pleckstrin-like domain
MSTTTPAPVAAFPRLPVTLRPESSLMTYYALSSLLLGPAFFLILVPLYFRYHTMRYLVEEEGITMRWGILFRREVSLTYARIQDIHLNSNFVERWLGLARVQVQTASGSATAEMTIEGLPQFEAIRDFLYARMRGARDHPAVRPTAAAGGELPAGTMQELTEVMREIAAEVRALRQALPAPAAENDHV